MPARVLVADDYPVVFEGIKAMLQDHDFEIVATVSTTDDLAKAINSGRPDVVIMDARLAGKDALKILETLPEDFRSSRVVVFSSYSHASHVARSCALGCHDFLNKTATSQQLLAAAQGALANTGTPDSSLLATTRSKMRRGRRNEDGKHPLTTREMQVLRHVAMGLSNREIGKSLGISVETVKEHVQNVLRKLNVNDRTQAAVWAVRGGII